MSEIKDTESEVAANPPKRKNSGALDFAKVSGETGEIPLADVSKVERTRENELGKSLTGNQNLATPQAPVNPVATMASMPGGADVLIKPTLPGPFKIGPKFWFFKVGQEYRVPPTVKEALRRRKALAVI